MNAPSVTEKDVLAAIKSVTYTRLPNGRTTICQLTLDNDFTVEGKSACVSAENYDQAKGERFAYEDALDKVWSFLGFRLADRLMHEKAMQPVEQLTFGFVEASPMLGDQVLFFEQVVPNPATGEVILSAPMLAQVSGIPQEGFLNLTVFAPNGTVHARENAPYVATDAEVPDGFRYFARPRF